MSNTPTAALLSGAGYTKAFQPSNLQLLLFYADRLAPEQGCVDSERLELSKHALYILNQFVVRDPTLLARNLQLYPELRDRISTSISKSLLVGGADNKPLGRFMDF